MITRDRPADGERRADGARVRLIAYGFQLTYCHEQEHQLRPGRAGDGFGVLQPHPAQRRASLTG